MGGAEAEQERPDGAVPRIHKQQDTPIHAPQLRSARQEDDVERLRVHGDQTLQSSLLFCKVNVETVGYKIRA